MIRPITVATFLFLLLAPGIAFAQALDGGEGGVSAELGFGKLDEDWFLTTRLQFGWAFPMVQPGCAWLEGSSCATRLGFGVQLPLRLRVIDNDPQDEGVLSRDEWQDWTDYLRILRFVEWGNPAEPLHMRVGELGSTTLGHGTIINRFYNVVTHDRWHTGIHTNVHTDYGGAQLILDDVFGPHVVGTRVYVRPWSFIDKSSTLRRLAFGASVVVDPNAPTVLAGEEGAPVVSDARNEPAVQSDQTSVFVGLDVEYALVSTELFTLTPYLDLNIHIRQSPGFHLGILSSAQVTESIQIFTRVEGRVLGRHYLPDYMGPLYQIERFQYVGWGTPLPAPKLRVAASQDRGWVPGVYAGLGANFFQRVEVEGEWSNHRGVGNSHLLLRAALRAPLGIRMAGFWYKASADTFVDTLRLDGAFMAAELRVPVFGPLFAVGRFDRMWRLYDNGVYETVDDFSVGIQAAFSF